MTKSHRLATNTAVNTIEAPNYGILFPSPDSQQGIDDGDDDMTPFSLSGVAFFPEYPTPAPKRYHKKGMASPLPQRNPKKKRCCL